MTSNATQFSIRANDVEVKCDAGREEAGHDSVIVRAGGKAPFYVEVKWDGDNVVVYAQSSSTPEVKKVAIAR